MFGPIPTNEINFRGYRKGNQRFDCYYIKEVKEGRSPKSEEINTLHVLLQEITDEVIKT